MTPAISRIQRLTSVSLLASTALVLSYLESMVPLPVALPGVKLGLGNVAVVVALFSLGARPASGVALAKVIASGLLFGSPVMLAYSLGGTAFAFAGMLALYLVARTGPVAVSMTAALLHNAGQIIVAALLLKSPSVFLSLAPLAVAAYVTGALTGAVAATALASFGDMPRHHARRSENPLLQLLEHMDKHMARQRTGRAISTRRREKANVPKHAGINTQKSGGFGVFRPGASFVHHLDPRTKIVFAAFYFAAAYLAASPVTYALVIAAAAFVAILSGMSWRAAKKTFGPFAWLVSFIVVFDALFVNSGDILLQWGMVCISAGGIAFGVESALRFLCVLLATSTLMSTTSPTAITDGFASLMAPLRRFEAHIDDAALVMGLTLRFIPLFSEEMTRLRIAQNARLANYENGSLIRRVLTLETLATPLLAGALRQSMALATSIEARGFGTTNKRTCLRNYHLQAADWAVIALGATLTAACMAL